MAKVEITSPVGRLVDGSLYEPQTKDAEGKPLVIKTGPNAGQPRVSFYFALAVPKAPGETHFAQTAWGAKMWQVGHQAFPQAAQSPAFAWKVEDGDSQIPNKKGRKNCDREGYPGNWIIKFSGGFPPKCYQQEGGALVQIMQPNVIKPGYYVEVAFSVDGNGSASQPGIYVNHSMVCLRGYGQEIVFGPDVNSVGFGQSALPVGASMTPPPSALPMPAAGVPGVPPIPGAQAPAPVPGYAPAGVGTVPPGSAGYAPAAAVPNVPGIPAIPGAAPSPLPPGGSAPVPSVPVPGAAAPIPVIPNPGFVQVPPPAAPVAPVRQMTAAAQATYEQYIAQGWNDALLIQHGLMVA